MSAPAVIPTGWQCPVCGQVWRPDFYKCQECPRLPAAETPIAPAGMFDPLPHGQPELLEPLPRPSFQPADPAAGDQGPGRGGDEHPYI